jgi:ribosomal protein S18 acetylase RimI-like enzyme
VENLLLRTVDIDDEAFLNDLFFDVRSVEFIQAGLSNTQIKPLLAMQYNAQRQSYSFQYPNAEHSIIEFNGENVGRLLISRNEKNIHLIDIAIMHNFRGNGIGNHLLDKLKTEAASVTLSVFKTNFGAIRLYEKHGFVVTNDDGMYLEMEWKNYD